ncbi:MAG: TolC family protein [Candidatus Brocadiia bacterium]
MTSPNGRRLMLVLAAFALLGAAGCFPTRESIYSDLYASRRQSYARWARAEGEEEALPRMSGDLGLQDAVRVGLAYNQTLQRALQEKLKGEGRVLTAYGEALPQLDLSAGYTRLDQVFVVDLGVDSFQVGDKNNWSYQLNLTQPIFKGGAIPAAIRGAVLFRYWGDERVRQAVQDVVVQTAQAYYGVLLAARLYEVQEESLRFAEANLRNVVARQEQGVAIRYDRLRAELDVASARAELIRQRNELSRARTGLFRAMGVSQKSEVELTDQLTYLPMEPNYDEAVREAFMNRPNLFRAELDLRLQQEVLRGLFSEYWPQLEAWGWFRWAKPDPHEQSNIEWDRQWQAGLGLTWTLFDGLRREGNIIQQRAVARQSAIELADREQAVLQEVRTALLDLNDASELVDSQRLNLEQANEALRLVTVGAREGVNTELEVLDARAALTRARGDYYQALHSHALARLRYRRAVGVLGPAPGDAEVPEEAPQLEAAASDSAPQHSG